MGGDAETIDLLYTKINQYTFNLTAIIKYIFVALNI